ncbi:uncharacterized protein LOC141586826 [Silene latifolia]|uniref:uncharacterized protein LOC141586826 n=1 Tax=Silene latifolia TaxID=37657 RepID=UPI003D7807E3
MNSLTTRTKPISQLLKPNSRTLFISLFSTSSPSSSPHYNSSSSSLSSRRHDEESRSVRVSVWWDIENCGVPSGVNVFKIAQSITSAVRANGIKGPVQITAFGDILCLNRSNQEALSSTGVNLIHIPNGGKNSADRSLLVDLMYWVSQNPPPAHIFLISGDKDFAGILHKLRMSNYNILLAAREVKNTSGVLYSAASIMWYWNELAKGENLSGKHFNQPPDGPFNSWYGHYRGPLQDPFTVSELQKYSEAEDSLNPELASDSRLRPVPMAILRQLRRVLNSHVEGLKISELRDLFIKDKVVLDKDFYGHKKFSRFLMAFPRIVKVEHRPDGQFFVKPVSTTSPKPVESKCAQLTAKENDKTPKITRMVVVKMPAEETSEKKVDEIMNNMKEKPAEEASEKKVDEIMTSMEEKPAEETSEKIASDAFVSENGVASIKDPNGKGVSNVEIVESPMTPTEEHNPKHKNGFFKNLWTKLFLGSMDSEREDGSSERLTSNVIPEKPVSEKMQSKSSNAMNLVAKTDTIEKSEASLGRDFSPERLTNVVLEKSISEKKPSESRNALSPVAKTDTLGNSEASLGFIAKIINWCKTWRNETGVDKPNKFQSPTIEPSPVEEDARKSDDLPPMKKLVNEASPPRKHDLFTKDPFWSALRSFFKTHRGSEIVFKALSREQIAYKLRKEGPLFLRPLQSIDIHHLVDLLITEKKWIKELPTQNPRFKLVSLYEESSAPTQPHNPTGLSSIFSNPQSPDNSQLRVSSIAPKKISEKSRTEILSDCQKLLDKILTRHPDGFNMALFKKRFLEKYGYALDHQKLGYPKLVSLLQVMPGVKVEADQVFPDNVVYSPGVQSLGLKKSTGSDTELSDSARKDDEVESPWEELGPVTKSDLSLNGSYVEYESAMSVEDEFSDSEKEDQSCSSNPVKGEEQINSKVVEGDNSLLQILNSWYSTNDESDPRGNRPDSESPPDFCEDETSRLGSLIAEVKGQAGSTSSNGYKHGSKKKYTFVAEGAEVEKGILIDGILGSLKKSGEVRV